MTSQQQFLTKLRQTVSERFNEDEVRTLCFELGIDYDSLGGEGKGRKVTELIDHVKRYNRIDDLLRAVKDSRPDIDWDDLPRDILPISPRQDHVRLGGRDVTLVEEPRPGLHIPCTGRPETELMATDRIYLLTDANEWFSWEIGASSYEALPPLPVCSSAIIDSTESLIVGLYEMKPARLREDKWVHIPYDHAILSLASTSIGIVVGDVEGNIAVLSKQYHTTIPTLHISEPVLELIPTADEGIVALGVRGGVWVTETSLDLNPALQQVDLDRFEQPFALYKSGRPSSVLLMGDKRLAHLHYPSASIKEVSAPIDERLRLVCVGPNKAESYGVLTDSGMLYLVSRDLKQIRPVQLVKDEGEVTSIRALTKGGLLARTTRGNVYLVEEDGAFRYLAGDHVVMAFALPGAREVVIVRWQPTEGARVLHERIPA